MERIFSNLYRFTSIPNKKGEMSHSYLLKRDSGNLLVCHSGPSATDIGAIESLGGIDSQWVCHQHDVSRDGVHEDLHARFGCMLYHHRREKGVRKKTTCPGVMFDDSGIVHGSDFEALFDDSGIVPGLRCLHVSRVTSTSPMASFRTDLDFCHVRRIRHDTL